MTVEDLIGQMIAVPGELTTAFLVLNLMLGRNRFQHQVVRFDQILESVANGQADSGLIIHEGQLTYARQNLHSVVDLGQWWYEQTRLPLPLGGNCIRRDLGSISGRPPGTRSRRSCVAASNTVWPTAVKQWSTPYNTPVTWTALWPTNS
jgi:predicted solute-binding protein